MMRLRCLFVLLAVTLFLVSCESYKDSYEERAKHAEENTGDIVIGIVDSGRELSLFLEGVTLAVEEINREGGLLGRPLRILYQDDEGDLRKGQQIARNFARNHEVVAVIGHLFSSVAIPVSITYERSGIVFMTPWATQPSLTKYAGEFTFRNIPNDEETGRQVADFIYRNGVKKTIIIYERGEATKRLVEIFSAQADSQGVEVVATRSYFSSQEDFRSMLSELKKNYTFDSLFIAGFLPAAAELVKQVRTMGLEVSVIGEDGQPERIPVPIIGTDGIDSPELLTIAGKAAEGMIIPTVFNPRQPRKVTREFVKRFASRFGIPPDTGAAQGYDAVQLLAAAIVSGGSTVPLVISTTLRFWEEWEGVTGTYSMTPTGDITGKTIFFKDVQDGKFVFLETGIEEQEIDPLYVVEDITLRLPLVTPVNTLDPGVAVTTISAEVIEQLFLGLTDFDPVSYEVVPELAINWTVSEDGRVYTFQLRQDVFWTDGTTDGIPVPVTAHDVLWSIRRNIAPETNALAATMLYAIKNAQAIHRGELLDFTALGVRAIDDFTLEFTLENPAAYFPAMVAHEIYRPVPRHVMEQYGADWTAPQHIQTNGSYYLADWQRGTMIILRKNSGYYDAKSVSIPEVRYYIVPDSSVGMAMYRQDQLDMIGGMYLPIPKTEIPRIKRDPTLNTEYSNEAKLCTVAYGFNTRRPPVDNPLVRRAISAAIDRQLLIDLGTERDEKPATTFTAPTVFGAVDPDKGMGIEFDPLQAQQWLAEAGYPDGKGFPEIVLAYETSDPDQYLANVHPIRDFLEHYLKIKVILKGVPFTEYRELVEQPHTPHMFWLGWCADYPDAHNFLNDLFHPDLSPNYVGWDNAEFAALVEKAGRSLDPQERERLYQRAEQILTEEEAAVVPIYFDTAPTLVKSRVKNWHYMVLGGQHIRNWYLEE